MEMEPGLFKDRRKHVKARGGPSRGQACIISNQQPANFHRACQLQSVSAEVWEKQKIAWLELKPPKQ